MPRRASAPRATAIIGTVGATLGVLVTVAAPLLSFRPNRVVDGVASTALEAFGLAWWALVALWVAIGALALLGWRRWPAARWLGPARGALGTAVIALTLWASGQAAATYAAAEGSVARTSFSSGFYLALLALFLVQHAACEDTPRALGRAAIVWSGVLAALALLASGALAELGMVREFSLARDVFSREFGAHLFYAFGATLVAVLVGVPTGILAARSRRFEAPVMGALNLGQVFPALAFIGLMMPIFGSLGRNVKPLGDIGVAGIGWAPVFVVLVVYALYPVVRNTLVAIRSLDPDVLDAAKGMGMSRWNSLADIELPLAFPIVLAGIRVALVQSTAGAILAAFVGGGGLGAVMFIGLEQTSMDLVLIGVLPIVALALAFDAALRSIERATGGAGGPDGAGAVGVEAGAA